MGMGKPVKLNCRAKPLRSSFCYLPIIVQYYTSSSLVLQRDQTEMEWKQVSMVIDRFLLLIFFLAMTIASLVILTSSPHISGAKVEIDFEKMKKH